MGNVAKLFLNLVYILMITQYLFLQDLNQKYDTLSIGSKLPEGTPILTFVPSIMTEVMNLFAFLSTKMVVGSILDNHLFFVFVL